MKISEQNAERRKIRGAAVLTFKARSQSPTNTRRQTAIFFGAGVRNEFFRDQEFIFAYTWGASHQNTTGEPSGRENVGHDSQASLHYYYTRTRNLWLRSYRRIAYFSP